MKPACALIVTLAALAFEGTAAAQARSDVMVGSAGPPREKTSTWCASNAGFPL